MLKLALTGVAALVACQTAWAQPNHSESHTTTTTTTTRTYVQDAPTVEDGEVLQRTETTTVVQPVQRVNVDFPGEHWIYFQRGGNNNVQPVIREEVIERRRTETVSPVIK
jgi:hypothetical protein